MDVLEIKCSNCGSTLDIEPGMVKGFCKYCGTPFVLQSKNGQNQMSVNIPECLSLATQAEESTNFAEAIRLYDKILSVNPTLPEALAGKAFASLTVFNLEKINAQYFAAGLNNAVKSAYSLGYDMTIFNAFMLDKSWSVMPYLVDFVFDKFMKEQSFNPRLAVYNFMENLFFMHHAHISFSNIVDSVSPINPSQLYIDGYKELKNTIITHCNLILEKAKEYRFGLDRQAVAGLKAHRDAAQTCLRNFNRVYPN